MKVVKTFSMNEIFGLKNEILLLRSLNLKTTDSLSKGLLIIDDSNIDGSCLSRGKLHLNRQGIPPRLKLTLPW